MFDEKNSIWLELYKGAVGIISVVIIICGIIYWAILADNYEAQVC